GDAASPLARPGVAVLAFPWRAGGSEPMGENPGYRIRDARFAVSSTGPVANSPQNAENAEQLSTGVHRRRAGWGKHGAATQIGSIATSAGSSVRTSRGSC